MTADLLCDFVAWSIRPKDLQYTVSRKPGFYRFWFRYRFPKGGIWAVSLSAGALHFSHIFHMGRQLQMIRIHAVCIVASMRYFHPLGDSSHKGFVTSPMRLPPTPPLSIPILAIWWKIPALFRSRPSPALELVRHRNFWPKSVLDIFVVLVNKYGHEHLGYQTRRAATYKRAATSFIPPRPNPGQTISTETARQKVRHETTP